MWGRAVGGGGGGWAPPAAVVDAVVARGVRDRRFEVLESVALLPGWRPALDARTSGARDELAHRLTAAKWQAATVAQPERGPASGPGAAPLPPPARAGGGGWSDQAAHVTKDDHREILLHR